MVLNKKLEKPFSKVPPEGTHLDTLNPAEIKAKLSTKASILMRNIDRSSDSTASIKGRLNSAGSTDRKQKRMSSQRTAAQSVK
jgi:hypothetical protein